MIAMKIPSPRLIASYPRSGNTWLRFILSNLFRPEVEHDFRTTNEFIPYVGDELSDEPQYTNLFLKTHALRNPENAIFLHRHVGDVLISEYWYKKKFYKETLESTLLEFLIACDFGANWRLHVDHYLSAPDHIGFHQLSNPAAIQKLCPQFSLEEIGIALKKSEFWKLRKIEVVNGLGDEPVGDTSIRFFRIGKGGQWFGLGAETQELLLQKNEFQLMPLGYL